jgi:hypothetical protein
MYFYSGYYGFINIIDDLPIDLLKIQHEIFVKAYLLDIPYELLIF